MTKIFNIIDNSPTTARDSRFISLILANRIDGAASQYTVWGKFVILNTENIKICG